MRVPTERSITAPETEIGYYQKDSLLLEDVLREQVLLSLPVRTLCKPDCKGLCPRCGQNRNSQDCSCEEGQSDPRWEALSGLRSQDKVLKKLSFGVLPLLKGSLDRVRSGWGENAKGIASCRIRKGATHRAAPPIAVPTTF